MLVELEKLMETEVLDVDFRSGVVSLVVLHLMMANAGWLVHVLVLEEMLVVVVLRLVDCFEASVELSLVIVVIHHLPFDGVVPRESCRKWRILSSEMRTKPPRRSPSA